MELNWWDYFDYSEDHPNGLLWAKKVGQAVYIGKPAGWYDKLGYYKVDLKGKQYLVHRIIYEMFTGQLLGDRDIDHVDGNPSNNVITNLRAVSHYTNMKNKKMYKNNKSGITGVILVNNQHVYAWTYQWKNPDKKSKMKSFAINKYGYDRAFELACNCKKEILQEMIDNGVGYTERHGK